MISYRNQNINFGSFLFRYMSNTIVICWALDYNVKKGIFINEMYVHKYGKEWLDKK